MKPRIWPVVVTLVVALVLMLFAGTAAGVTALIVAIVRGEKVDPKAFIAAPWAVVLMITLSQAAVLVSTRVMPALLNDVGEAGWAARVRWVPSRLKIGSALLAWLGVLSAGQFASFLVVPLQRDTDSLMRFDEAARSASPIIFGLMLISGALAPGLVEELLFRGLVQSRLVQRFGPAAGIGLSAVLFGAYHLDLRQGLAAIGMGVWLGWFAWRDGSMINCAIGHALNNMIAFLSSRFVGPALDFDRSPVVAGIAFVVLLICTALTWRFIREPPAPEATLPAEAT